VLFQWVQFLLYTAIAGSKTALRGGFLFAEILKIIAFGYFCVYHVRMSNKQVLIISDKPGQFSTGPQALPPEKCFVTRLDSIRYLDFSRWRAVVIDCASIDKTLKKVSLGIRDDAESDSLWQLLSESNNPTVFMLVEKMARTSPEMQQMGMEYITPAELSRFINTRDEINPGTTSDNSFDATAKTMLTADDIRELNMKGLKTLPAGCRLTPWAAELADSLQMTASEHQLYLLLPVTVASRSQLAARREELFELASRHKNLFFIVNEIYLPIFNELFPALSGRTVAPTVHWASHGAFTGEVSVQMLVDQRCFGAIVPAQPPYTNAENLKKLVQLSQKHGLKLFCTFTLASAGTCDIIAPDHQNSGSMISLYHSGVIDPARLPESGAVAINNEFLQQIAIRKGN